MASEAEPKASPAHDCWTKKAAALPGATGKAGGAAPSSGRGELIAKCGTVVSAIMASSCCWLPPLLIIFGISGAGIVATLEEYRAVFMVVTFGFLGMAFYFTYRPRGNKGAVEDRCAPASAGGRRRFNMMTMNKIMLWAVTVMAVVFLFFPQYVTALIVPKSGEFTADMNRVVLTVDGMTCLGWEAKAETALLQAPGVLAVEVSYKKEQATVGIAAGADVPRREILAALKSIDYSGEFVEPSGAGEWSDTGHAATRLSRD